MRMRKLVAATLLAGGALILLPSVASAQEQPSSETGTSEVKYADHTAEECAKLLEEGK
jgi:hypothetical protein